MSRRQREDPVALAALGVVVLVALATRLASSLRWHAGAALAGPALGVLAGAAVLSVCAVAARVVVTRRSLRSRVCFAVVPADEFDPSPDAVVRFAAQLGRVRRSVRGWLESRASAVRIRLSSDAEGRLVYVLEVPRRAEGVARTALRSYEGVELREASGTGSDVSPGDMRAARAELVLARPSVEPLARLALQPDPLQPFAAALESTRARAGDSVTICIDLLPTSGRERRRLRRRLVRDAQRLQPTAHGTAEVVLGSRSRTTDPAEAAGRREVTRALDAKLKDAGPLFSLQVLVRCESPTAVRAKGALASVLAAFEQFADRNWLRVAGVPLLGAGFVGSDFPARRWWFDHRLDTGLFRPARRGVVTAREVAGLLKPPTVHCAVDNVLCSGALVAPPPELPAFDGQPDLVPLGRVALDGSERVVGVRLKDTFFSYVAGRSRYGKTELAVAQFLHLVRSGHGGLFLDPHEDAVARIKRYLTGRGLRERVVAIDLAGRRAAERQPAWNLFELGRDSTVDSESRVEAIVDAFASALRWDERNTRAINLTTQAAQALTAIARVLPAELCPTIFQLPTLLSDDGWRRACLPYLPAASRRFWLDRFPRLAEEAITPVTNLIDRLRASTAITALLGQSQSSYRVRDAMDRGLIVLACPGSGGTPDRLVANLLVFDLLHAAKARADLPPERRRPFFVFLDEVQTYDGASSGNLAALLEQTAKYGVRAFLLNQNPERLTSQTLNAVTTNRSHLLATALNARAAGLITKEWGGQPSPAAITRLPRYRFLAQVTHRGEASRPFQIQGVPVEQLFGAGDRDGLDALELAIDRSSGRRTAQQALAHLDALDDRILHALKRQRATEGGERTESTSPPNARRKGGLRIGGDR